MSQISQLDAQIAEAMGRLRVALTSRDYGAATGADEATLVARIAALEAEKLAIAEELDRLRAKRDKDVAALDELISQLKPLIEEV